MLLVILAPLAYLVWTGSGVWAASQQDERPHSDAIVVMGAAQYDGHPSTIFKARLDHAGVLFRQKVAPLIVVLGGKRPGDRFTEAQAGAAYLERIFPADKVTGVKAGSTTLDSLRKFIDLAAGRNIKSLVIVSDPTHLARSQQIAQDLGFKVAVSRAPIVESSSHKRWSLVQETARLAFYRIFNVG